jgi:hypothetical protein
MAIDVEKELNDAQQRLPVLIPDGPMPLDIQMRSIALTVAARFCADTTVKEGGLYQQLKMDNKLGNTISVEHVLKAALTFERYLWGEWSRGIAEHAVEQTSTEAADAVEAAFKEKLKERGVEIEAEFRDEPPIRPHGE